MKKWCYAVSDYCREVCPVAVFEDSEILSSYILEEMQDLISAFLCKHEDYNLRFVSKAEEADKLKEEGYSFLTDFNEEQLDEFIDKYKVISE